MNDDRTRPDPSPKARSAEGESTTDAAWGVFSYLVAGLLAYGGIGWLIGALIHEVALCVTIGVVVGIALATTTVFLRYGRHAATVPVRQRSVSLRSVVPDPTRSAPAAGADVAAPGPARDRLSVRAAAGEPVSTVAVSAEAADPDGERRHKPKSHVMDRRETEHAN